MSELDNILVWGAFYLAGFLTGRFAERHDETDTTIR